MVAVVITKSSTFLAPGGLVTHRKPCILSSRARGWKRRLGYKHCPRFSYCLKAGIERFAYASKNLRSEDPLVKYS